MFSDVVKSKLDREVVGQTRAVNNVVRGVTRVVSGLTPRERTYCVYMLMGPTGTGKTLIVQELARILRGDDSRVIVVDAGQLTDLQPGIALGHQLMPLFQAPAMQGPPSPVTETVPLGMVRVENLDRAPKQAYKALAAIFDTGQIALPDGRRGRLGNCMIFLTSGLCSREILDEAPQIGFTGSPDEDECAQDRLYNSCFEQATKQFGTELVGRLDGLVIFHGLGEEHLPAVLDRRFERLNEWLAVRGCRCDLKPAARQFLLERGKKDLRRGALDLVQAHQRFVEFPVADLLVSRRLPQGGQVSVDRQPDEEHLHFTVSGESRPEVPAHEVPVIWEDAREIVH